MPVVSRVIDSLTEFSPTGDCPTESSLGKLQFSHVSDLVGILEQLSALSAHASDIFQGLMKEAEETNSRINNATSTADCISTNIRELETIKQTSDYKNASSKIKESLNQNKPPSDGRTITSRRSKAIQNIYENCKSPPGLSKLDEFAGGAGSCLKKYSDPFFFVEEWMKEEALRQEKALEERNARRQRRRELKAKAKKQNGKGKVAVEAQKKKLLSISTWKDKYGTGEGTEFFKRAFTPSSSSDRSKGVAKDCESNSEANEVSETVPQAPESSPEASPPPPPPPLDTPPSHEPLSAASKNAENGIAPHPPASPKPVVPPVSVTKSRKPAPMGLLGEIRAGRALKSVTNDDVESEEPQKGLGSILEQIKAKRTLRHVGERSSEGIERQDSVQDTSFTSAVSDILARRAVIACESDESDDSDADWS